MLPLPELQQHAMQQVQKQQKQQTGVHIDTSPKTVSIGQRGNEDEDCQKADPDQGQGELARASSGHRLVLVARAPMV